MSQEDYVDDSHDMDLEMFGEIEESEAAVEAEAAEYTQT